MREIKFRARRVDNGKWIEGSYVYYKDFKDNESYLIYGVNGNPNYVLPETVGQFTGLHDKNGKEIYENDLVRICFTANPRAKVEGWKYEVEAIYKVGIGLFELEIHMVKLIKPEMMIDHLHLGASDYCWEGTTFKIDSKYSGGEQVRDCAEVEVIGNIYETPELLTQPERKA